MPCGVFRCVLFVGKFAIKFPRLGALHAGLQCNRWEREVWMVWQPIFNWPHVCPVLVADPLGFIVVMPKCEQPVTAAEVEQAHSDRYPDVTSESKIADHGRLRNRVVALDYGLPLKEMVQNERSRYALLSRHRN